MSARQWVAACAAVIALQGAEAAAQGYPSRPIKIVVAYGAGGGTDIVARILAERLTEQMKVSVLVENREGAGGSIGTTLVARSPADGYTLLLAPTTLTVSPFLQAQPAYDPIKDFVAITRVCVQSMTIIASSNSPFRNMREMVAFAKANPGKLSYGTSGKGSPSHLEMEMIKQALALDIPDVPYKAFSQAISDTMSGQISFYFPTFPAALPFIKGGKVKALAVGSPQRASQAPEIPTIAEELGIPGYETSVWYGIVAPAGVPPDVVARLNNEITRALEVPEVRERIAKTGAEISIAGPEPFGAQVRTETGKWSKLVRELKLKATQ